VVRGIKCKYRPFVRTSCN